MFLCLFPFLLTFSLVFADKTTFQAYYSSKSVDEIRYIIIELERYIAFYNPQFKGKREDLSTHNKDQLTDYTVNLVETYCRNFENIEIFNRNIKIFDSNLSIDSIIKNGERQFLFKWAINAEKYKRRVTETSYYLGGLIDYAQFMKLSELKSYISKTIIEYPGVLGKRDYFDQEILNIKPYKESVFQYIQEAPLDVLRFWINNLDQYLTTVLHLSPQFGHEDTLKPDNPKAILQKNMYNIIKDHKELLEIEYFIQIIDYKNIKYIPLSLNYQTEKSIREISFGCEEYNRKQKKLTKSFRNLIQYHAKIPIERLTAYSLTIINEYPELSNFKLIDDLKQNNKRQNFGKVKDNIYLLSRKELIAYVLNARTIENQTDKFQEDLDIIFRMKDEELREMLINIGKRNPSLQTQIKMKSITELNNNSLSLWFEQMPQNILGEIAINLTQLSSKKEAFFTKFFLESSDEVIQKKIMTLSDALNISSPIGIENKIMNNTGLLYNGMYDYFKAINKETLYVWIKQFEQLHRQKKQLTSIIGGISNKKAEKKHYIGKLFYYLDNYPQFKDPKKFDIFVDLYKAHELVYHNETKTELIKIAIAFSNYHKRISPNLQYSMNIYNYQLDKVDINFLYFYIFKIMAIYPELNLPFIFKTIIEEPNKTNITEFLSLLFGDGIYYVAKNIQKYHNAQNDLKDTTKLEEYDDNRLKYYIQTKYFENKELQIDFPRLVSGQNQYLYWNNEEFFSRQVKKDLIIFAERMELYRKSDIEYIFKEMNEDKLKEYLNMKMNVLKELHNTTLFDQVINYVQEDNTVTKEYIEMFNKLPRQKLMQFSLIAANFYFIDHSTSLYPKVFSFLISATRNEMIRYICTGFYLKYFSFNDLFVYTKKLFLDYGEQSILDIVEFR